MSNTQMTATSAVESRSLTSRFQVRLRTREAIIAYLFLAPFIIFFTIFVVRAVLTAVNMSFYDWPILGTKRPFIGLKNYQELLNDYVWWIALKNTIVFAVLTVTGTTIVSLFAAVSINQILRAKAFFRVLLYMPSLLSVGVVGTTWVWLLNSQFGLINYGLSFLGIQPINWLGGQGDLAIPALSLTSIWWGFGFPMLIFLAGLQGIPDQLIEAARIDGANGRQVFQYVTLPLLRPTILFVTVTGFIAHFQVFGQPFIMTRGGPGRASYSVIYYLYEIAWTAFRMGYGSAVAIAIAVIIATFTIVQFGVIGRRVEY
jgi:multiple sugar transport system permease protein